MSRFYRLHVTVLDVFFQGGGSVVQPGWTASGMMVAARAKLFCLNLTFTFGFLLRLQLNLLAVRAMVLFVSDPCDENRIYPRWRHLGGISLMNFSDGKLLFFLSSSATMVSDVPRHLLDVYRLGYNKFCKLQIYKVLWML